MNSFKIIRLLTLISCLLHCSIACGGYATYLFQNLTFGLDAPVFDADGSRLAGTNYVAVLYAGPAPDSLLLASYDTVIPTPMQPAPFTYMPFGEAGYFRGRYVVVTNVPCFETPWLQVRAWDARLGSTYEEVVTINLGGYGESQLFQWPSLGSCIEPPTQAQGLYGLQSFALREVIPEPGSTLLLLLGLPALLFFRRRPS